MKTRCKTFWAFALTAALATFALVAVAQTPTFQLVPTPNQYTASNGLYASSASSPSDIWAVGTTTIHFDGKQWKVFPAPGATQDDPHYLRGVLDFSPTLAWAGGYGDNQGQVIDQWNGQKCERLKGLPFPPAWHADVYTMSATSSSDVWVTGSISRDENFQLFFEHWNGQSWGNFGYLPGGVGILYGASQDATNDAWAVGSQIVSYQDYPLVLHYDGTEWFNLTVPLPYGISELLGVLALAPNNVWAVGWQNPSGYPDYYTNLTLVYHYDGSTWTIVPSPDTPGTNLVGIVANSPTDMYAFGYQGDPSGYGFDTLLLHGDGSEWSAIRSPDPRRDPDFIDDQLLTGVVPSPGNVWILGNQWESSQGICTGICTLAIHSTNAQ